MKIDLPQRFEFDKRPQPLITAPPKKPEKNFTSKPRRIPVIDPPLEPTRLRVDNLDYVNTSDQKISMFQVNTTRKCYVVEQSMGPEFLRQYLKDKGESGELNEYQFHRPCKLFFDFDLKKADMEEVGITTEKEFNNLMLKVVDYLALMIKELNGWNTYFEDDLNDWFDIYLASDNTKFSSHVYCQIFEMENIDKMMDYKDLFLLKIRNVPEYSKIYKCMDHNKFPWMRLPFMSKYNSSTSLFERQLIYWNRKLDRRDNFPTLDRLKRGCTTFFHPGRIYITITGSLSEHTKQEINIRVKGIIPRKQPSPMDRKEFKFESRIQFKHPKKQKLEKKRKLTFEELKKYKKACIANIYHYMGIHCPKEKIGANQFQNIKMKTDDSCIYIETPYMPCPVRPFLIKQDEERAEKNPEMYAKRSIPKHTQDPSLGKESVCFVFIMDGDELRMMKGCCQGSWCKPIEADIISGVVWKQNYKIKCIEITDQMELDLPKEEEEVEDGWFSNQPKKENQQPLDPISETKEMKNLEVFTTKQSILQQQEEIQLFYALKQSEQQKEEETGYMIEGDGGYVSEEFD